MCFGQMSQQVTLARVACVLEDAQRAPRTYLVWSAAATILCLFPLGLVAVGYGLACHRALNADDLDCARRRSRVARRWLIAAVVSGLVINGILAVTLIALGGFSR